MLEKLTRGIRCLLGFVNYSQFAICAIAPYNSGPASFFLVRSDVSSAQTSIFLFCFSLFNLDPGISSLFLQSFDFSSPKDTVDDDTSVPGR